MKGLQRAYARDQLSFDLLTQSVRIWAAHLTHGGTGHLRADIFNQLVFVKNY